MSRDYTMSVLDPFVALVFALNLEGASIVAHTARPPISSSWLLSQR